MSLVVALALSASAESTNKLTYAVGASAPTASANTEFVITVKVTENTGICWLRTIITYDSTVLTYVGEDEGKREFTDVPIEVNARVKNDAGQVIVTLGEYSVVMQKNPTIYKNTGTYVTLKFKVNAGAPAGKTDIKMTTNSGDAIKVVDGVWDTDYTVNNITTSITVATGDHTCTAGSPVKENEKPATCAAVGSYDEVTYCTVCRAEMSRKVVILPANDNHTPGEATTENVVAGTCKTAGTYDSVVRCTLCQKIISSETKTGEKGTHVAGNPEVVHTASTCLVQGSFVEVYKCKYCGIEMDKKTTTLAIADHSAALPVRENEVKATCSSTGSYTSVVYCSVCKEKLSSENVTTPKADHLPDKAVEENRVESKDCLTQGSYDSVVYCSTCKSEISRTTVKLAVAAHTPGPAATETNPQICTVCNVILKPVIAHTHTWQDTWTTNKDGHWYACPGCSEKKDYADHTFDNNCDADCSVCAYTRTPADHVYGSWTTLKEATATEAGQRERACIICGVKQTEEIPAIGETTPPDTTTVTPPETSGDDVTTEQTPVTSEPDVTTEETPGSDNESSTGPETPDATDPADTDKTGDNGCGSAVSMGIALIAILGTALIMKKRD